MAKLKFFGWIQNKILTIFLLIAFLSFPISIEGSSLLEERGVALEKLTQKIGKTARLNVTFFKSNIEDIIRIFCR